jgi:hypothetical protein
MHGGVQGDRGAVRLLLVVDHWSLATHSMSQLADRLWEDRLQKGQKRTQTAFVRTEEDEYIGVLRPTSYL